MADIETDYLVIGGGAAGLAFVDELIAHSDADVVMVERRQQPGGHWNDVYPFVRLHLPSANYGVSSRSLGTDTIDASGPNAGLYERATGEEINAYYRDVLAETLLGSGRVRFYGGCEYLGPGPHGHRFVSLSDGEETTVRSRRRVVDATWFETPVPATHTPTFDIDPEVRFIPINELAELDGPAGGYTIVGAGKTGIDACIWLLENGVGPDRIRWIKPRDAWFLDRASFQPLELLPGLIEGQAQQMEAAAGAETVEELFDRLEAAGQLLRLNPDVEPSTFRCAMLSAYELDQLRRIENVVRRGRVQHIGTEQITLDEGSIPTDTSTVHVDCSAPGLRATTARPIFEPGRITLQQVRMCQPTFNAALVGFLETSERDDADRNRLAPPNPYPNDAVDWIPNTYLSNLAQSRWGGAPDLAAWLESTRLNLGRGIGDHADDPTMQSALTRLITNAEPALVNLEQLWSQR
ncbi:MAG: NAD(P)-binding protein [Acidimicrobiales bacterium]|nr:NAD(P)-binding protein [Acidimicrobiales bacterium]